MRVLVTGGAGFIGSHVADRALAAGHEVAVLDDLSTGDPDNVPSDVRLFEVDMRDAQGVAHAFDEFSPHVVSHHAAQASVAVSVRDPSFDAEVNVLGSLNVMNACRDCEVSRIVFASTGGAIYGEVPDGERAGVGRAPVPISPYACSKLATEAYLHCYREQFGLATTILRYANVYGPRQDPHGEAGVVAIFAERLLAGQPVLVNARVEQGDDGCVRDYVVVHDVVRANMMAIEGQIDVAILDVGTGSETSTHRLAQTMKRLADSGSDIGFSPKRAGDIERSVLDPSGYERLVGKPDDLEIGLAATMRWYREDKGS